MNKINISLRIVTKTIKTIPDLKQYFIRNEGHLVIHMRFNKNEQRDWMQT